MGMNPDKDGSRNSLGGQGGASFDSFSSQDYNNRKGHPELLYLEGWD